MVLERVQFMRLNTQTSKIISVDTSIDWINRVHAETKFA